MIEATVPTTVLLSRLSFVTPVTQHLALRQLFVTTDGRPRPNPVVHLALRVDVVQLQVLGRITVSAALGVEVGFPSTGNPLALVSSSLFWIRDWHGFSVSRHPMS